MTTTHIRPELFNFFRELKANNDRDWFEVNKQRYETHVKEPLLQFISDFGVRLAEISPHYIADARTNGGSMFRIYRDVRFSKDKSPYKTAAGLQFRHESGKDVHAPGFYLHLEPDGVFAGVGIWHPNTQTLNKIRDTIVAAPDRWQRAVSDEAFRSCFELSGESLKRPPKGYDADHLYVEDVKRKDFIAAASFSEADACDPAFIDRYAAVCQRAAPFMEFLTRAVGLAW
jgi:uncharacterized protein (TIGR02453 family)